MFIENIKIEKFKGFSSAVEVNNMKDMNLLIYGENGSGKSSLYEAIRLTMYYNRLYKNAVDGAIDPADEIRRRDNWLTKLAYAETPPFIVEINNTTYNTLNTSNVDCYMLSYVDSHYFPFDQDGKLSLNAMLWGLNFPDIPTDFVKDSFEVILAEVNSVLKKEFYLNINITVDGTNDYNIIIEDRHSGLKKSTNIDQYFNEAKLTIINLLIKLSAVELLGDHSHEKLLILDDVISSMDMANRTFFTHYILTHFYKYQKIILTHNASYYNLFQSAIILHEKNKWIQHSLLVVGDSINIASSSVLKSRDAKTLNDHYITGRIASNDIANKIRQCLETQIHELALWLHMESVDQSGRIINNLLSGTKKVYLKVDGKKVLLSEDLNYDLQNILNDGTKTDSGKVTDCLNKIREYDCTNELTKLIPIIKEVRLYEKLVLHQLSHGRTGLPSFSNSEIKKSLDLLIFLSNSLADISKNIYEA
ncbi:AAA family ATPase [uncultured Muribaculum sp.]|uniref:AAA family ATPase n=1 Tax=uncultured Muribaculum sp. TaxID=1918613 RepID=UPI0027318CCC|nr:AAA family ATPase [uncultured Muribaculum sp.]